MIAALQRRPVMAALGVVALLLVLAIGLETGFGTRLRPSVPQESSKKAAAPEAKLLPALVAVAPEQAYPETAARPLFTPTRRPAPADTSSGKPAFSRGQFVLQGVIVVGEERTALLKEKTSGKIHRVERGKDVNGITVEKIEPTEVTLAMNGEQEKLALVVQRPEGAAGARGAAAATAATAAASHDATQGPFGAVAAPAPAAAANVAGSPVTPADPTQPARGFGNPGNPVARAPAAQPQAAQQPSTQPMSPEELLARRRARRNQPTQ